MSFKIKTDVAAPTTLKWLVEDTKILGRRLGTYYGADNNWLPDIDDFREDFTISSADGWKTISRTINPQDRDAAVLTIAMGNAAAGTYWIDDVKVVGLAPPKPTDFKVVGYYPPYRLGSLPIEAFEHIDVLNHSALMSAADGSILRYYKPSDASTQHNFDKTITDYEGNSVTVKDHLLAIKAAHGLELIVTVIGKKADTRSSTDGFIEMLLTQARRETFADNLVQFCLDNGFDGVDLNFEWPSSLNNSGVESEQERYRYFIEYLREALDDEGLKLSQAPGLFGPAYYDPDTYWRMDRNCHQGYNRDDELYLENILRAFRVAMPFHTVYPGIIWAAKPSSGSDITYRTLYAAHAPARHENYAGDYYFNGIDSVRQKVQIARRLGCAGVMIWELGQDTVGEDSSLIRRSLEDCDGDALLDKWEEEFSGGTNLRPLMDDDGDKLINLWENLTGTNPLDSSSMAGLSPAVTQDAGSDYFSVSLPYENPERLNLAIEATNDLADSESWQDLNTEVGGNAEATVTNDVLTVEQTNAIGSGSDFSFLRARVEAKE